MTHDEMISNQRDELAWHIWNWRSKDEVWKYYGDARMDFKYASNIMEHFENKSNSRDWLEREEDLGKWREFLMDEYISYIRRKNKEESKT